MFADLNPGAVGIEVEGLEGRIAVAGEAGFGGVDCDINEVAALSEPGEAKRLLDAAGLSWGLFGLPIDVYGADEDAFTAALPNVHAACKLAASVGCTRTERHVMPGHNEMDYAANLAFSAERLKRLAEVLGEHGIRHGVEFIGPRTLRDRFAHEFIHTMDQALELADAADPSGEVVGISLDTFHWYTSGGTAEEITGKLAGRIVHVHVNDARPGRGPDEQIDGERNLPAETGVIDSAGFMGALRDVGYDGPMMAEPFQPWRGKLSELPPAEAAAVVMSYMTKLMAM